MTDTSSSAAVKDAPHADALSPRTRLGEFEILSVLGVGGFGVVYKAFDHSLHRAVAIKEYLPLALAGRAAGLSVSVRTLSDEPAFQSGLKSFVGEARLLAQFDHPSLVKVFRFWEAHNTAYMVMPLYNGMTLKQARAQMRTPPPEAWLRQVLWSVLGALHTLHESQTLHRDISPDNIFLQDIGPPVLLDLGAARHAINDRDHQHTAVLKVNYAPIEQYANGDTDLPQGPWSDLYSLAAVVHGCLCNDTPLPSTLRSIRDRMVPFAHIAKTVQNQFNQAYSPTFIAAITQSLSLQPQDRPQSIDAFLQTMDMLSPPSALESFDFRAELGDIWVEPTDQPGPGQATPTVDLTDALLGQLSGRNSPRNRPIVAAPAPAPISLDTTIAIPAAVAPVLAAPSRPDSLPAIAPVLPHPVAHAEVISPVDSTDFVLAPAGAAIAPEGHDAAIFLDTGDTLLRDEIKRHRAGPAATKAAPLTPTPAAHPPRRTRWGIVIATVLLFSAALGASWMARTPPQPLEDTIITEMAEPEPAAPAPEQPIEEVLPNDSAPLPEPAGPPPAFVEATPKSPAALAAAAAAAARRSAKAAAAAEQHAATPAPVAIPDAPVPPPAPKPAAAAPAPTLCNDTNFFTRSACVYEECAKPANANLSMCVEHRHRLQKESNNYVQ
jgi:serine/threonine protein kinase